MKASTNFKPVQIKDNWVRLTILYRPAPDTQSCAGLFILRTVQRTIGDEDAAGITGETMQVQTSLKFAAATALATILSIGAAQAQDLKIGAVGPKTGPLAGGAAVTHFPNFQLWAKQVNDRGGLKLKGGQRKIELIEYDDRSQPPETIKAVERLATVDKADFIMAAYGTGYQSRHRADLREIQLSADRAGRW